MTQEGVKNQQRDQNSTAKEGHNSTKNPLNIDPGSVFNEGVKILSYTGEGRIRSIHQHWVRTMEEIEKGVTALQTERQEGPMVSKSGL